MNTNEQRQMELYTEMKEKLGLVDEDVALMFGYKDRISFRNAKRFTKLRDGLIIFCSRVVHRKRRRKKPKK